MLTHNHTRKPSAREFTVRCIFCTLTARDVRERSLIACCVPPEPEHTVKPQCARDREDLAAQVPPYRTIIEAQCDYCGGDGRNHGLTDDYEPCEHCKDGRVFVLRNWLGEAFQIESGLLTIEPRREHLTALRHYATRVLNFYNSEHAQEVA
jgi:hypothetical protein